MLALTHFVVRLQRTKVLLRQRNPKILECFSNNNSCRQLDACMWSELNINYLCIYDIGTIVVELVFGYTSNLDSKLVPFEPGHWATQGRFQS